MFFYRLSPLSFPSPLFFFYFLYFFLFPLLFTSLYMFTFSFTCLHLTRVYNLLACTLYSRFTFFLLLFNPRVLALPLSFPYPFHIPLLSLLPLFLLFPFPSSPLPMSPFPRVYTPITRAMHPPTRAMHPRSLARLLTATAGLSLKRIVCLLLVVVVQVVVTCWIWLFKYICFSLSLESLSSDANTERCNGWDSEVSYAMGWRARLAVPRNETSFTYSRKVGNDVSCQLCIATQRTSFSHRFPWLLAMLLRLTRT